MALTIDDKIKVRQIANEEVAYSLGETNQRLTAVEDRLSAVESKLDEQKVQFDKQGSMLKAIIRHLEIPFED